MSTRPLTDAERQRRFRDRRKHNLLVARAELPSSLAEYLINVGLLCEEDSHDPRALGDALVASAQRLINGA